MNKSDMPRIPNWLQGTEMGEFIYAHDWAESGLGPIETWPPNLRLAVNIVLLMPSPALLLWGPQLIQIYNDGCRDLIGAKHPACLGVATRECWPELWSFTAPICEGVMQRWESFTFDDKRLVANRYGVLEEVFVKLNYSPVPGDTRGDVPDGISGEASNQGDIERGVPGGVLVMVNETTEAVRGRALEAEHIRLDEAIQKKGIRLLEEIFRTAPSFIYVLRGPELVFELANDAYYQLVGHRELIGRSAFEALPETAQDGFREWVIQVMTSGKPFIGFELPVNLIRKPGNAPEERFVDLVCLPLFEDDGTCQRVLGHGVDVTAHVEKRKKAEKALRESEERFRAMAEASPALTWQVDVYGKPVYVNQRLVDMIGMGADELMPDNWRSVIHPDDARGYVAAFEQALHDRSRFQQRFRAKTKDGKWRWLESYALPWFNAANEYAGHAGLSIDITDAVNAEAALVEASRRKDEFLATLAHELRNPLAPISNALGFIARPGGAEAIPRLLPVISRQVNHMVRLVDDLLEISRITSGKIELRKAPTDMVIVLRNAVEASMPLIDENEHELNVVVPSEAQAPLVVHADSVRLEQLFTNLLNNAARYTRKGGQIWLTARRDGGNAVVSVRDNGIGILPDMLPRLFDMFAQECRNGAGAQEGLGIGLNLVYRILQMHGGTIEARSEGEDRGSEFIVRLPLAESSALAKSAEPERAVSLPSQLRVLVVDDNRDAAEILSMLLASKGVNVQVANSGPAALAAIPGYRPNVILMDIGMPGMDGYEAARRIRDQPQFDDIKLVALTGWGQEEDRRLSRASGFDHHLTKPVDFKVLEDLIASM